MATGSGDSRIADIVLYVIVCAVFTVLCTGCAQSGERVSSNHTQQSASGNAPSDTPQTEAPDVASSSPMWPTPEALQATLKPWLSRGTVTVDWENSTDEQRFYVLPPGSFRAAETDDAEVSVAAYRYADNRQFRSGVYDVEREYGGSSPEEVYSSAVVMIRDVGAATGWEDGLGEYPDVAGGMVTDEWNELIVAGDKDYWYEVSITGVTGNAEFNDALVGIGRLLAE